MGSLPELKETRTDYSPVAFYENNDVLLNITSKAEADTYIMSVLNECTKAEKEAIIRAYFGLTTNFVKNVKVDKKRQKGQKKGGSPMNDNIYDNVGTEIVQLLAFADSAHDFVVYAGDVITVEEIIGTLDAQLPTNIQFDTLRNPFNQTYFIKALTSKETLTFESKTTNNPLFKVNILDNFDIVKEYEESTKTTILDIDAILDKQMRSIKAKIGHNNNYLPVEIWTIIEADKKNEQQKKKEARRRILKLVQVAQLIGLIQQKYSTVTETVIDASSDSLYALVIAMPCLAEAFFERFTTVPLCDTLQEVDERLKLCMRQVGVDTVHFEKPKVIDANIFDAANNPLSLLNDVRPTGPIYPPNFDYQVTLHGINVVKGIRSLSITIQDTDGTILDVETTNKQCTDAVARRVVQAVFSIPKMLNYRSTNNMLKALYAVSPCVKLALKRAGDWGQVVHCKRYNKLFVTGDKFAALFAALLKVRFIYIRHQENLGGLIPNLERFFKYTFVLG